MSNKLYPPIIEGTIPSFYGTELKVPFQMNRAVGQNQFNAMSLTVKSVNTNIIIISEINTEKIKNNVAFFDIKNYMPLTNERKKEIENELKNIEKDLSNERISEENKAEIEKKKKELEEEKNRKRFAVGTFYKVQIAYIDNQKTTGYYSTVAVVKYTTESIVTVTEELDDNSTFFGTYQNDDISEKVYSYRFKIFDNEDNSIFADSGVQLHNSSNDKTNGQQQDSYTLKKALQAGKKYSVQYSVTTVNKMEASSGKVDIIHVKSLPPTDKVKFETVVNRNKGCITFKVSSDESEKVYNATFVIVRSSEKTDYQVWEQIHLFRLNNENPDNKIVFNDFTVEQGVKYKYALQQVNLLGTIYSERFNTSNDVTIPQFEDMFLFDGERQLKVKFNPKISSFKKNLQEQKTDTIGNKYPFIMRNGNIEYISFQIQGLISTEIDDENTFLKTEREEYFRDTTPSNKTFETGLYSDTQVKKERDFRTEVFNWLTNGEPKLFKSSTEGNYIVRLMNVSLTPKEELSRILYEFSCEAYEVAEAGYDFYIQNKYITIPTVEADRVYKWATVILTETNSPITGEIYSITLEDMLPGDIVYLNDVKIIMGVTGQYSLNCYDDPIKKIDWTLTETSDLALRRPPLLTYCYLEENIDTTVKNFDNIKSAIPQLMASTIIVNEEYTFPDSLNPEEYLAEFYTLAFKLKNPKSSEDSTQITFRFWNGDETTIDIGITGQYQLQNPVDICSFTMGAGVIADVTACIYNITY